MKHATDMDFNTVVQEAPGVVVVYFSAVWCAPCARLGPAIEGLAGELVGEVEFVKVDVDESPSIAFYHGIQSVPTLALYQDGTLLNMTTRPVGRASVLDLLEPVMQERGMAE